MFHPFSLSRLKTKINIETTLLYLSPRVILSHISHIHNRLINHQVRLLLHQHLLNLFHHIIQGRRHLTIPSSTTMLILTTITSIRSIMEMG